ncbi:Aste57867_4027 [Aphanomyces stellatus]|uniref:sphingomyelin phosphodiesterase n=1 Tax=Aphanomyces stellatus TaxID=120398 RepID=A0A485KF87_9STRA|nr:hypothetical protein As57867_004016 [Aphanomyces stellatus]VFT81162.1 Aste57867_4027 [Aphanomyces stellatus]
MAIVRVLSLNVFLRPPGIQESNGDHKELRLEYIKRKIIQYDVVLLQEMFVALSSRAASLIAHAHAHGLCYHAGSVYPSFFSPQLVDGGLLILSRFPICKAAVHRFSVGCGSDGLASKGVVFAQVQVVPNNPRALVNLFTTHTQAGIRKDATDIRWRQILELARFVRTHGHPEIPALVGGDFNLDARHDVDFVDDDAPAFSKCPESLLYKEVVRVLSDDGRVTVRDVQPGHGVTNANGHGVLCHTWPDEMVESVGKCIDYLFLLVGKQAVTILDAAVDRCEIKVDGGETPRPLPITHLSDHWGLTATLEFAFPHAQHALNYDHVAFEHASLWMLKATLLFLLLAGFVVAVAMTILMSVLF